ncbi:WD repeat-containing protein 44-like [Dorcoceras hygrometricum]|uniref:WD repeat-containing protein 44-like n=1 Tax=Dorcoceras hygrometricum TaxID=472368 RepID=A0A2Z7B6V2_9LAMI|nr:WD repeat-containing protein 44-like [Dorcoceras hygrometricum]
MFSASKVFQNVLRKLRMFKSTEEFIFESSATTSRYTLKGKHQNDIVPTNSNDVAALHQLTTDISCEEAKICIGYPPMRASGESSTTKHRLLHASGSQPIPPPNDPKTNQYNQDLGLIHSTNGNHLDSIGYPPMRASGESSTTKHRLLHASGSQPIPPPNDPKSQHNLQPNPSLHLLSSALLPPPPLGRASAFATPSRRRAVVDRVIGLVPISVSRSFHPCQIRQAF